jgi:hypothetical protein
MSNLPSGYCEPESLDDYLRRQEEDLAMAYVEISRLNIELNKKSLDISRLRDELIRVAQIHGLSIVVEPYGYPINQTE